MFNLFPRFERGRIMKKELLWALRDYSYESLKIQYQEYSNGILKGLDITVEDEHIVLGRGMVKFGEFIYLVTEPVVVPYEATNEYVSLKGKVNVSNSSPDAIRYGIDFVLDRELERREDEFEVCRFKLRQGAKLRNQYKAFYDIETEYDTVNLAHATWAGVDGETLSPVVIRMFVENAEQYDLECADQQFCNLCRISNWLIPRKMLSQYIDSYMGVNSYFESEEKKYEYLDEILRKLAIGRKGGHNTQKHKNVIIVD